MRELYRQRLFAILEAFFVTFLWSSSYILVKIGLGQISPLMLVSLRYMLASFILLPIALVKSGAASLRENITLKFFFLGLSGYTIAQGLQCIGLFYLPAISVTFILNFTPLIVVFIGYVTLREIPTRLQLGGMALAFMGAYIFLNAPLTNLNPVGVMMTVTSGVGWAIYLFFSRLIFTEKKNNPLELTAYSMSCGTIVLAAAAFSIEGFSSISLNGWSIIIWLGVVNTALAFFLWNHALQKLEAFEISILQNTMLVQIALLSWWFLGEKITTFKMIAMALVFIGALVVQLKK